MNQMKKIVMALGVAVLGLAACNQFKKGEGDMMYKIYSKKDGTAIAIGDLAACRIIEKTEEDSILFSSYDYDRAMLLIREKSAFQGDLFAALGLLSEGDSASFKINMDSIVAKTGRRKPTGTKGKYLVYTLKIEKVVPKGNLTDSLFRDKVEVFWKSELDKAKNIEEARLKGYIASNNLKPIVTPSGLNYVITKEGTGAKANVGDTVEVNYTAMLLSGKVFDTSLPELAKKSNIFNEMRTYSPLKVAVGTHASIPGFDEGLSLFPQGTKAMMVLPSKLAYGEEGNGAIQPYTPLAFEVEILNIIPKKAGATVASAPTARSARK